MTIKFRADYRENLYLTLLDFFKEHLIISEFTESSYGTEVSPSNAYILLDLQQNPQAKLSDIAKNLSISSSTVTRGVHHLISSGYLLKQEGYSLTSKGFQFLELQEKFNKKQITNLSIGLNNVEIAKFANYFWKFADDQGAPVLPLTSKENQEIIKIAIRRVTRLYQIIGSGVFRSNWNALDWLIFAEIDSQQISISELAIKLKVSLNTLSQRIKAYQTNELIDFQSHPNDQRVKILVLTSAGESALSEIEEAALKIFSLGFKKWELAAIEEYLILLKMYLKVNVIFRTARINSEYYIRKTSSNDQLQELRWMMIKILASSANQQYPLSENFFSKDNLTFLIFKKKQLFGGLELIPRSYCEYRIVNLIQKSKGVKFSNQELDESLKKLLGNQFSFLSPF